MGEKQLNFFNFESPRKTSKERNALNLPLDTLMMLGVVLVLLLALSFSLGVERGRKLARGKNELDNQNLGAMLKASRAPEVKETEKIEEETMLGEKILEVEMKQKTQERIIEKALEGYVIQVASYIKETAAQKEADRLEGVGYPVSIAKKGKYIVVYVGQYNDKDEAKQSMKSLKGTYKDCFIRRL